MNNLVISGLLHDAKLTSENDKHICHADFEFPSQGEDKPIITSQLTAWGSTAEKINSIVSATIKKPVILVATLNVDNDPDGLFSLALQVSELYVGELGKNLNVINLVGRAGRDPEVRYFDSGTVVANFSLAVNRMKNHPPNWFNLEIWGKQAQIAADYVRKGALLGITGSFDLSCWTDKTSGEIRSKPLVKVKRLSLLGGRTEQQDSAPQNSTAIF